MSATKPTHQQRNNNGDTAHLYNAVGALRDACTYSGGTPGYVTC